MLATLRHARAAGLRMVAQRAAAGVCFGSAAVHLTPPARETDVPKFWKQQLLLEANSTESAVVGAVNGTKTGTADVVSAVDQFGRSYGTGRRKEAVARVWVFPGTGSVSIDRVDLRARFPDFWARYCVMQPFQVLNRIGQYDVYASVKGGGFTGQAEAVRLGISRALTARCPSYRPLLKQAGFLTRDSRVVERKKTGKLKARKSFPYVKR